MCPGCEHSPKSRNPEDWPTESPLCPPEIRVANHLKSYMFCPFSTMTAGPRDWSTVTRSPATIIVIGGLPGITRSNRCQDSGPEKSSTSARTVSKYCRSSKLIEAAGGCKAPRRRFPPCQSSGRQSSLRCVQIKHCNGRGLFLNGGFHDHVGPVESCASPDTGCQTAGSRPSWWHK